MFNNLNSDFSTFPGFAPAATMKRPADYAAKKNQSSAFFATVTVEMLRSHWAELKNADFETLEDFKNLHQKSKKFLNNTTAENITASMGSEEKNGLDVALILLDEIKTLHAALFTSEAKEALKAKLEKTTKKDGKLGKVKKAAVDMEEIFNVKKKESEKTTAPVTEPAKVVTKSALEIDGVKIDEFDIKAIRLARAASPLVTHLYEVLKSGGEFTPSKLYEAGEELAKLIACEDSAEVLAISLIPGVLEMMRLMDVESEDTVAVVHAIVDQFDAARDAWVAASVRNLQSSAETATPVEPAGTTEKARQVNQRQDSRRRGK